MKTNSNRKLKQQKRKEARKQLPLKKKILYYFGMTIVCIAVAIFILASVGTVAHATGLVDETINASNEYSKYGLSNYQLDFYVDNSWGWLPWNWGDGLGKSVMYGLYAITNFIWTISLYLSNATGYLVQEAYSLDFISQTANSIGRNIQTIAGITPNGFSSSGFYVGFLLILVLLLGVYVTYTGLIKRETTKAVRAVLNFVIVFILSASFIAFAPDYITKINDFSKDISNASLDVGTKIVMPNSKSQGKNSVDMIRDSLFSVQVKQPWLLLQYGSTDIDEARVEKLLSISPDTKNGEDREKVVINEIEKQDNANLSISKVVSRLGTVFFLFIFNIGISIFVFLLTGIMIFSQVLFIIFAMFLPISFLLSMIPSFDGMGRKAIMKLFNTIMTRAGITLIITVAFSISTMLYSLSSNSPFFMIMFLQIVTFAGIYFKLGDLMNMFALQSSESQQMGRQILRRPSMIMNRQSRKLQHGLHRALGKSPTPSSRKENPPKALKANYERSNASITENRATTSSNKNTATNQNTQKGNLGKQFGEKVGHVADTKNHVVDKVVDLKDQVKDVPTNVKYAVHKGKRNLSRNASDFVQSISDTKKQKQQNRANNRNKKRDSIAQKRMELDRVRQEKSKEEPYASIKKRQRDYEERKRPATHEESKANPVKEARSTSSTSASRQSTYKNMDNPMYPVQEQILLNGKPYVNKEKTFAEKEKLNNRKRGRKS